MTEVWECMAYCLMPNHFHLLVRIKEIAPSENGAVDVNKKVSRQFSHFANSYAQAFNKN